MFLDAFTVYQDYLKKNSLDKIRNMLLNELKEQGA